MSTLTIRGVDELSLDLLRKQAKNRHSSVNKFVVETLQTIVNPDKFGKAREWHDLDNFFGSWSESEYNQIKERCNSCRRIDTELWR